MIKLILLMTICISQFSWGAINQNTDVQLIQLKSAQNIRKLVDNILEVAAILPSGTTIQFLKDHIIENYNYRDNNGNILRSSTGFVSQIQIIKVTKDQEVNFPPERIKQLNSIENSLFITSSAIQETNDQEQFFALKASAPTTDYLSVYYESGKAKLGHTSYFIKRFGNGLNHAQNLENMPSRDQLKWPAIINELSVAARRDIPTAKKFLFMDTNLANELTIHFEATGETSPVGAWSMAVQSTAVRHGFENVPCAEFMSEMIRQAYNRAGYDFREDFNNENGNYLIWDKTAAVVNLTSALFKAGWIPWELITYSPPAGAIIMNELATSPGHTYISAGDNGRFIVDNGSPAGRDLRKTSKKILDMMFSGGVFFLPPGILPKTW